MEKLRGGEVSIGCRQFFIYFYFIFFSPKHLQASRPFAHLNHLLETKAVCLPSMKQRAKLLFRPGSVQ